MLFKSKWCINFSIKNLNECGETQNIKRQGVTFSIENTAQINRKYPYLFTGLDQSLLLILQNLLFKPSKNVHTTIQYSANWMLEHLANQACVHKYSTMPKIGLELLLRWLPGHNIKLGNPKSRSTPKFKLKQSQVLGSDQLFHSSDLTCSFEQKPKEHPASLSSLSEFSSFAACSPLQSKVSRPWLMAQF